MADAAQVALLSTRRSWPGIILSGLAVAFLIFDVVIKFTKMPPVAQAFQQLGLPLTFAVTVGVLELACVAVYVVPQTAALGAILLTAFLGGAVLAHVRVGDPLFSHTLFPVYIGVMIWGGLFLRDKKLRALLPVRS